MVRFRKDLNEIIPYRPGKPIEQAARDFGLAEIIKLASNESPYPPFPEVQQVIAAAAASVNRYPDNEAFELRHGLAAHLGVADDRLLFGGGSAALMLVAALAMGGPGTSAVYSWPSFGLYRIATKASFAEGIEVPLDVEHRHDLDAMAVAIRPDTSIVYVCNPNNPTGTHVGAEAVFEFIEAVPSDVLIVVDEAYCEYVQAADYSTALPFALERHNVLVAHTFSKVYGLAGLRCGYMVGDPATIAELRRVQAPFTVDVIAQIAAAEAIKHQDRVAERVQTNAEGVKLFTDELTSRGIEFADSQCNFVYMHPGDDGAAFDKAMRSHGIVVRPWQDGWIRVTIGTEAENHLFFAALDNAV